VVLATRRALLEPQLATASAARRLLRLALTEAERAEWIDAAELALGEVVANAVLHAHTTIELTLEVRASLVHVEVRDRNPAMPIPRDYDAEAMTGRGMALVAAVSQDCGVRSLGPAGKVVWFDVGPEDASADTQEALLDAWSDWDDTGDYSSVDAGTDAGGEAAPDEGAADEVVHVQLLRLPPLLWLAARQHHDALARELVLHAAHPVPSIDAVAADQARSLISQKLAGHLEALRTSHRAETSPRYSYRGAQPWMPASLDLVVPVPRRLGPAFPALQDALDTAERLAANGELFASPGLPEIVEVRDWVCSQVQAQLAGVPASPWPGSAQTRFETMARARAGETLQWDASTVAESARGVVAGDEANRIVAISRPLADALGWEVDDLVGRRVVTLIPPALREAHVAAFTRHLATGDVHVLGQHLQLPVLRKDGTEVLSDFMLERAEPASGPLVFLAWIDPLG